MHGDWLSDIFTVPTVIFVVGGVIAIVAIVFGMVAGVITRTTVARERERSRREIAAYVAEGSIEADKAVEIMNAGGSARDLIA